MKRYLLSIVFLLVAGALAGCSNQTNADGDKEIKELKKQIEQLAVENDALKNTVEEQRKELEKVTNNDNSIIPAKDIDTYPRSLYKKTTFDIDQDGEEEIIELYVNAQKMENGVFAWDDGQTWLLVVKDGEITYPLFDDFVQLGAIDFSVTAFDGIPGIVMLKTWHADKSIFKFSYDFDEKGFVKETLYKKENMLEQYNQPASYAFFKDAFKFVEQAFTEKAELALDANEYNLQDRLNRAAIFDPILSDLGTAKRLFATVGELNPELTVSLDSAINRINEMVINQPTTGQLNQLRLIYDVFKEKDSSDLIIKEENQIHPDAKMKLHRMEIILNGIK